MGAPAQEGNAVSPVQAMTDDLRERVGRAGAEGE